MEIWVANRDGSNPYQLTAVGGAGTPRWSPDSQSIAFDVGYKISDKIVTISLNGGAPHVLAEGLVPSWSHDDKWVYFAPKSRMSRLRFAVATFKGWALTGECSVAWLPSGATRSFESGIAMRTWLFVALKVNGRVQFFRQPLTQAAAA
jgi:Tol biopolymer transport system component